MVKRNQIPWQVGIQGGESKGSRSSESSVDDFWDSMSTLVKMKTASEAGGLLNGNSSSDGNAIGQMTEVAKAFGINMPEMAKEQNRLIEQIAEAKQQAASAEGRADYGRLEAQFENLKNMTQQSNQAPDPLRDMAIEIAKTTLARATGPGDEDPVANAYKQFIMNKTLTDLEMSQSPPTVADQVGSAVETLKAIKDLSTAFSPPPAPIPMGLSPERNMELELKKLEIEQQLEMYRIQQQTESDRKRADSMQQTVKMIGNAIEGIGRNIAEHMMGSQGGGGVPPSAVNHIDDSDIVSPSATSEEDGDALVGKLECPDCGQEAVYITQSMWEAGQRGENVPAACASCGAQHHLGDEDENEEPGAYNENVEMPPDTFAPPSEPQAPRMRQGTSSSIEDIGPGRNGKKRPPRRNFVSVD
jgi:molecular chaperone GrpE (heat shock protein)/transcription elongation factor Elf1